MSSGVAAIGMIRADPDAETTRALPGPAKVQVRTAKVQGSDPMFSCLRIRNALRRDQLPSTEPPLHPRAPGVGEVARRIAR